MPTIRIMTRKEGQKPDLKKTAEDISASTGIPTARMNLFIEEFKDGFAYSPSGNYEPIVHIAVCRKNGQEWTQRLMTAAAKTVASQLSVPEKNISVFVQLIDDGNLLVNGNFI